MRRRFLITLEATLISPLHISGPGENLPLIDRCIQVDHRGEPIIPASSLRGRARAHLERLARLFGHPICTPPRPELTCPHNPDVPPFCLACRIFGSSWRQSHLAFNDMTLISTPPEHPWHRTGVGISRYTGTVREERLFVTQTLPPLQFEGTVEGELEEEELGWLLAACRTINHIGGEKARGMGRLRIEIRSLRIMQDGCVREANWREFVEMAIGRGEG
jgi:CRISPR/Cas system CSM-associated protein Csm3 (group 7 of RAMP superfamily)